MHWNVPVPGTKSIYNMLPKHHSGICITEYIMFGFNNWFGPRLDSNEALWHWIGINCSFELMSNRIWFWHPGVSLQRAPAKVEQEVMSVSRFTVNALDLVTIKLWWGENSIMKLTHNNSWEKTRLRSTGELMYKCNQIHCIGNRFNLVI